jgi:hypothetical protein
MSNRIAAFVVIPVVLIAGVLALQGVEHVPDATAASTSHESPPLPAPAVEMLPLNHPPIGGAGSPHGSLLSAAGEAPALAWKVPAGWDETPSPNAMRLATYRAPGRVDVSVSRAGGATEANIQRWTAQFDDVVHEGRLEKTVRGLRVVTVDVAGTYVGGGMTMGGPVDAKPEWAMVGAIVESRSPPYFFKMTGPAAGVRAARPAFDRLIDGVTAM